MATFQYMTPVGAGVSETTSKQFMTPQGAGISETSIETFFPSQFAVPTAVALFGITP